MKRYEFTLSIGFANGKHREIIELDDDLDYAEIEEAYMDWRSNYLDGGWHLLEDGE